MSGTGGEGGDEKRGLGEKEEGRKLLFSLPSCSPFSRSLSPFPSSFSDLLCRLGITCAVLYIGNDHFTTEGGLVILKIRPTSKRGKM